MEGVKDLEAEALSGDPKAQALLHFLRLLRRKDYAGARAYAEGFPEGERERLLRGLSLLEEDPEALDDPFFAAEKEVVLGVKAVREGRREEAEAHFKRALALDPAHHRALTNLGTLHLERGSWRRPWPSTKRPSSSPPRTPSSTRTWPPSTSGRGTWTRWWPT